MPTVPLIELSRSDIPGVTDILPPTGESLRQNAIARARKRLGIDQNSAAYIPVSNVQRDGNEYVLKITKATLNKMLHPAAGAALPVESIVVMDNLERIANNGVYFKSEGDRDARPQIPGWDHLMTTVYIDGELYSIDMRIKLVEEKPGSGVDNVLYYYSPEELLTIKKVGSETPTVERRALNMNSELEPTSDSIIPQAGDGVNVEYAQKGGTLDTFKPALLDDATADDILRDRSMVSFLTRKRGLGLRSNMTQAEKRQAVREAMERVTRHNGEEK